MPAPGSGPPLNEYEYYPNGDWHHAPIADRWQMRISWWIKAHAPHGHVVAARIGPKLPSFAARIAADPEAVDTIMFQEWGPPGRMPPVSQPGSRNRSTAPWQAGAARPCSPNGGTSGIPVLICACPVVAIATRTTRVAVRGAACFAVWGSSTDGDPCELLGEDQPGLPHLLHVCRFVIDGVPFHALSPASELLVDAGADVGRRSQALATGDRSIVADYLPVGGEVALDVGTAGPSQWFEPRSGKLRHAECRAAKGAVRLADPTNDGADRPADWVLVTRVAAAGGA